MNNYRQLSRNSKFYKWCLTGNASLIKYNTSSSYGTVDNKTILDPEDDAAAVNWGGKWRMPTYEELTELCEECCWIYTPSYNESGIAGYIVYKAKSEKDKRAGIYGGGSPTSEYSLSDKHIFLPCSGYRYASKFDDIGSDGKYWSSSLCNTDAAYILRFSQNSVEEHTLGYRDNGFPVRAVCK